MPEGDTIHHAVARIRPVLVGQEPEILAPHPRQRGQGWERRLAGRGVAAVDAHGKHLFIRFGEDLTLHSHLRMTGAWGVYRRRPEAPLGSDWKRGARRAWLVMRTDVAEVVQFDGPVLELMTESRRRFDLRLAALGPDILGEECDMGAILARLREGDPTRPIGEALLDQRTVAGIGNIWKSESCFGMGIDPWRTTGQVRDEEVLGILGFAREQMAKSAWAGFTARPRAVYGRLGESCPRCGATIHRRGQGEDNRLTFWCGGCQR